MNRCLYCKESLENRHKRTKYCNGRCQSMYYLDKKSPDRKRLDRNKPFVRPVGYPKVRVVNYKSMTKKELILLLETKDL